MDADQEDADPEEVEAGDPVEKEEDDDESDSGDSSSSDELEIDSSDMEQLMKLEAELEANQNLYDSHIKYIELLRKCKLKVQLRAAQERMSSLFPLSEQLWIEWVNDELAQVEGPDDIVRIRGLFAKATEDYLSVNLWCSYLEFVLEFDSEVQQRSDAGLKLMRELCEKALTAVGLHVVEGARVWALYRDGTEVPLQVVCFEGWWVTLPLAYGQFELALEAEGVGGDKQQERVRELFRRQLQVPLADSAATLNAYTAWEAKQGKEVPPFILKALAKAQEAVRLRTSYEAAISADRAADAHLLAAFMAYIKLELSAGEPARVQCLYERAVAVFPVTTELWMQYGRYLEVHLRAVPGLVSAVYGRALRNCYWVGALWARALRAAAREGAATGASEASLKLHSDLYERAIKAGLQEYECYMEVILARLDGLRQAACSLQPQSDQKRAACQDLQGAFQQAGELLSSYFPDYQDRSLRLPSYWAHCEAIVVEDMAAARRVWEHVTLKTNLGRYYESWASYAAMERSLRHVKEARAIYKRAYSRKLEEGGQLALCSDWLKFEREEGSPDEYLAAALKVEPILEEAAAAAAAAADAGTAAIAKAAVKEAPKLSKEQVAQMRRQNDPNFKKDKKSVEEAGNHAGKRRLRDPGMEAPQPPGQQSAYEHAPKRAKLEPSRDDLDTPMDEDAAPARAAVAAVEAVEAPVAPREGADVDMDQEAAAKASASSAAATASRYRDDRTVFVKGLRMNLQDGELDGLFHECGDVEAIRLMRDADGRFRGFAYIEFKSEEGLKKAVALNGSLFQGKPLFVAKSQPPGGGGSGGGGSGRGGFDYGGRGRFGGREGGGGFGQQGRGRGGYEHGQGRGGRQAARGDGHLYSRQEGGRDGSTGGRGGGRSGLGYAGHGRGGDGDADAIKGGHHRHQLQLQANKPGPAQPFVPRSVAKKAPAPSEPLSNAEFRNMLLAKKPATKPAE